jgi:hypothetical protein
VGIWVGVGIKVGMLVDEARGVSSGEGANVGASAVNAAKTPATILVACASSSLCEGPQAEKTTPVKRRVTIMRNLIFMCRTSFFPRITIEPDYTVDY